VRTNDNIDIIVPNSSFTSFNVINWSHGDHKVRFRLPVPVAYGSDVLLVERILLEVAEENENVLQEPSPRVIFKEFGDSGLEFELRIWTSRMLHRRGVMFSQLNFAIFEKFREHQIRIPFPQRDVHLKTVPQGWESSPGG
jgi:small-conductance mechanosensitive channel